MCCCNDRILLLCCSVFYHQPPVSVLLLQVYICALQFLRRPWPLYIQRIPFKCIYSSLYHCFILVWASFHYCKATAHLTHQQLMLLHYKLSVRWFCSCVVVHLGDHSFTMLLDSKTSDTVAEKEYKYDYFHHTLVLKIITAYTQPW